MQVIGVSVVAEGFEAHHFEVALYESVAKLASPMGSQIDRLDPSVGLGEITSDLNCSR
jgi:hypothetical protein